jgi:deazaflavin-dependent oxidoreductase (nitroreductase family)
MAERTERFETTWMRLYPRDRLGRVAMKAPLILWRMGLGRVLGTVLMVITHTGRSTGLPRHTVVEWHPLDGRKVCPVAFGERAQWYRNIMADPVVTLQTADGVEHARAYRVTDDDELRAAYRVVMRRNPTMLRPYLASIGIDPDDINDLLHHRERLILLAFEPTDIPAPPPLQADLVWLWPFILLALFMIARPWRRLH